MKDVDIGDEGEEDDGGLNEDEDADVDATEETLQGRVSGYNIKKRYQHISKQFPNFGLYSSSEDEAEGADE